MSKALEIDIIRKEFIVHGKPLQVLDANRFDVAPGEFVSILGPSGCGKTTLLRMIAGLENNYNGKISLDGEPINTPGLDRGIVFQEPRLLPWMCVTSNLEFAIPKERHKKQLVSQVQHLIHLVGLKGFEKAFPNQLSGGMAQRVALARALVNLPSLLLLDEPFGALDSRTRMTMQDELLRILHQERVTTLMVTHDVDEAAFLSDKIVIMGNRPGSVELIYPIELKKPRNRLESSFINVRNEILEKSIQFSIYPQISEL